MLLDESALGWGCSGRGCSNSLGGVLPDEDAVGWGYSRVGVLLDEEIIGQHSSSADSVASVSILEGDPGWKRGWGQAQ